MKSILDPTFVYKNSVNTDIRKTFKRIRKQIKEEHRETVRPQSFEQEEDRAFREWEMMVQQDMTRQNQ